MMSFQFRARGERKPGEERAGPVRRKIVSRGNGNLGWSKGNGFGVLGWEGMLEPAAGSRWRVGGWWWVRIADMLAAYGGDKAAVVSAAIRAVPEDARSSVEAAMAADDGGIPAVHGFRVLRRSDGTRDAALCGDDPDQPVYGPRCGAVDRGAVPGGEDPDCGDGGPAVLQQPADHSGGELDGAHLCSAGGGG